MDNPFKSPAVLSFCPGILGLERGLARAGVNPRIVAYVEIEAFIIANLVAGMEAGLVDTAPIWTDAKTFDASPFHGKIHGIIGGYPCPGESTAGLREGHLYKGFLWPAIRKAIATARPLWCFFENVDDHLTGTYPIVLRSLRNMGYAVEAGVYSAEEVGAPHERKRIFILALENTYSKRLREQGVRLQQPGRTKIIGGSKKLANSNCNGSGAGTSGVNEKGGQNESKAQRKEWQELFREWMRDVTGDGRQELGNSGSPGLQGASCRKQPILHGATESFQRCLLSRTTATNWPAGQGVYQYPWEEPRTIESGMGCTIDGYNFREDLLRALGNSVVEQTAEIAFIDLLKKHFI